MQQLAHAKSFRKVSEKFPKSWRKVSEKFPKSFRNVSETFPKLCESVRNVSEKFPKSHPTRQRFEEEKDQPPRGFFRLARARGPPFLSNNNQTQHNKTTPKTAKKQCKKPWKKAKKGLKKKWYHHSPGWVGGLKLESPKKVQQNTLLVIAGIRIYASGA